MEAAAVLSLADAMLPAIDIPEVAAKVQNAADLLKFILRICFSHLKRGIPELPHLSHEDHQRISNFMYVETPADVEEFKAWIKTVPDPDGTLMPHARMDPLGACAFRDLGSAGGLSTRNNLKSPPTHLKPRLLSRTTHQSVSALTTSPEFVAAAQTATPAQLPRKRLKLGSIKGWGVQRDEVAMSAADYAKTTGMNSKRSIRRNQAYSAKTAPGIWIFNQPGSGSRRRTDEVTKVARTPSVLSRPSSDIMTGKGGKLNTTRLRNVYARVSLGERDVTATS
ncbi:hypothetical protein B0H14DRAFT_2598073 [Mycena olivaceomarginata]|nr:hypothetical protein B0H14DRAFT_2598073 [Mycena olivaceomarginata]